MVQNNRMKILFICTHNSARSQMAEGIVNSMFGDSFEAFSAGTNPSSVNPYAISAMKDIGIDIGNNTSKSVDQFVDYNLDYTITVCDSAKESCPVFRGAKKVLHKDFNDPSSKTGNSEEILEEFKSVRDQIITWFEEEFYNRFKRGTKWY